MVFRQTRQDVHRVYELMSANQAASGDRFPIRTMCRVLGVSSSGYHDWCGRRPSVRQTANARLAEQIRQAHQASDATYGMPRVRAQLKADGHVASRKRIARLMRQQGLRGVSRRQGLCRDHRA